MTYMPLVVKPEDLPTAEEIKTGKSERPEVQKLLDSSAFKASMRLTEHFKGFWW